MHGITKLAAVPIALLLAMGLVPLAPGAAAQTSTCDGVLCAGAASVDMTWHVGAGQGQYGSEGNGLTSDKFDPFHHQTKMVPTDGMQSRTYAKAIVVRGADGTKIAYVKTDLYLQQDLLTRRVAELVAGDPIAPGYAVEGLDGEHIMIGTTHNHSAPEYASTAFGVWLFTDTFDFRMFEDTARDVARAIKEADAALTPAKIGASVTHFDDVQQNILGPGTADDGTPAGFRRDHFDDELTVIRFDRADGSEPIAAWANLGMHPESQNTTDLISADFTGMTERMVERGMGRQPGAAEGPVVAWSQGSVGDVEPDQSRANPPETGREYWHRNYAQMELMSRQVAAAVLDTWDDVAAGTPDVPAKFVAFTTDVPVGMVDYRFAGPPSHPLPTVSNCRTERPGAPIVGLPDCERGGNPPEQYGTTLKLLREAGLPIPGNYSPTSYEGVQESLRIHLQAIRLGDILIASCPCEPISDMTLNLKSRADVQEGMYLGYQWPCEERADGVYCDFATAAWKGPDWRQVDPDAYQLMQAQITNPADGWEDDIASLQGEAEAPDPADIYGNYTHREIQDLLCGDTPCEGYKLPVMVGQANDYVGYIVTYREYQRGDHYRKALTAFGPHTSDYINTRLVQMGAELKGGAAPSATLDPIVGPADELIQLAKSMAVGKGGTAGTAAYEAALPDDGGDPGTILTEPTSLERFAAATFSWVGGSNYTDNPSVVVQKEGADGWHTVATQEGGEVVVTLTYDSYFSEAPLLWLTGGQVYEWTATWEAFERTAPGTYRFAVTGHHRGGGAANPYEVASAPFDVKVWRGIAAHDLAVDSSAGTASFAADGVELTIPQAELETDDDAVLGPDEVHYPDTYDSELGFIDSAIEERGPHRFCWNCTFRPWADTGRIAQALVTVHGSDGSTATSPATLQGDRWVAPGLDLYNGDVVVVEREAVTDEYGNVNGSESNSVTIEGFRDRTGTPSTAATALTYTGDTSGDIGKRAHVEALLATASGEPVEGRTITFTRGGQSASATTHRDGRAKSKLMVEAPEGQSVPLIVEFAGDDAFSPTRIEVPFTAVVKGHGKTSRGLPAAAFGTASAASLLAALLLLRATTGRRRRGFNWDRTPA